MTPERWQQISQLLNAALACDVAERSAFLRDACANDAELRSEVESLLAQESGLESFLEPTPRLGMRESEFDLTGQQIGIYKVMSLLGVGGMGEVYRARDSKLGREVAIKILPRLFISDPDRLARFEREARVLASLNHPHIGAIYGVEDADGIRALVLELVEGETLADRIARGPIPLTDTLTIGRQIADALDTAHEKGIIHRDLKPANIKITPDGIVKVLDFGLAKAAAGNAATPDLTQSPTITFGGTRPGMIIGTAAYMSPEQARGHVVDKRTDVWAFGCVLYEMLGGRAAFARDTVADTVAAVVDREPDWTALPATTPAGVLRVLRWCLEKDPKRRLRDAGDVRTLMDDELAEPSSETASSRRGATRAREWQWVGIAGLAIAAIAIAMSARRGARLDAPEMRLEIVTPPTSDPVSLAISPDGLQIAFTASANNQTLLWVRLLSSTTARAIPGTEGATFPFWSPDSRWVGFFAQRQLKRIEIESGAIQPLAAVEGGRGGAWADDGTIIFQPSPGVGPLFRIAATGGDAAATTTEYGRFPQFLPDRRHFMYFRPGPPGVRGVYVSEVNGGNGQRVLETESAATYASSGHLLFVRQSTLFAQPFDALTLTLSGEPLSIATGLIVNGPLLSAPMSTSRTGAIVYRAQSVGGLRQFVWFDHAGKPISTVGTPVENLLQAEMSPDGRQLALHRHVDANTDVWLLELARGLLTRFTSTPATEFSPVWSPDGKQLVFSSSRTGAGSLHLASLKGDLHEGVLVETPREKWATDWSRDGQDLLFVERGDATTRRDLWVLSMRDRRPTVVLQTSADEEDARFSPDAKWIAYQSNESGRMEVYVQPFRQAAGKVPVSTAGGAQVRWRRDGKMLYYVSLDGNLMEVPVSVTASGIEVGNAQPLFRLSIGDPLESNMRAAYIAADDGKRFLVNTLMEAAVAPITVLLNWKPRP